MSKTPNIRDLIPVEAGNISGDAVQTVNARDLHAYLEVGKDFSTWIKDRIEQYNFVENQDFVCSPILGSEGRGGHNRKDYHLTLDMAKELSMVERNQKGKEARQYFIECERQAKKLQSPPPLTPGEILMTTAQAIISVEKRQDALDQDIQRIETQVEGLAESRVWDHCPQNCEPITKIRTRMNERYGLPQWVVDTVVWRLPLSPKPHGMVRNQREEAKGSQYEVYAVADITRVFAQFVDECVPETPMRASHRHIDKAFQLVPGGKKLKPLKAHADDATETA